MIAKNWVYIKFDRENQDAFGNIIRKSGIILPTSPHTIGAYKKNKAGGHGEDTRIAAQTIGTVIAFSGLEYRDILTGHDMLYESDLDFDTEEEIQVGDMIIYDHKEFYQAVNQGRCIDKNGFPDTEYAFINYSKIFVRIRDGEITPVNGYLLVEPMPEEKRSKLLTVDKLSETKGVIRYAGTPVKYRRNMYYQPDSEWVTVMPKNTTDTLQVRHPAVGDTVLFKDYNARDLQHTIRQTLPHRYFIMQRRDCLMIC